MAFRTLPHFALHPELEAVSARRHGGTLAPMARYPRAQAALRAGVTLGYLERLEELGILAADAEDTLSDGDVRRAQITRSLDDAGIPLAGLGEAVRAGTVGLDFIDSPIYERFAALTGETFAQVCERTGIPISLMSVLREATGAAPPRPEDLVREDEIAVVPMLQARIALGFRTVVLERNLRVMGDTLRRLAETESDAWRTEFMDRLLAQGMSVSDMAAASTDEQGQQMDRATDAALLAMWHAQQSRSWMTNIIGGLENALGAAGLYRKVQQPPAMCFLDITGYTRLTQERGDQAAASLAERLGRFVNRQAVEHGGRAVKWLGDGVMLYFRDPGPGVVAALDMVDTASTEGLPPAHVGIHAGPVLFQEGDYYGQTVNIASRIAEYARPGEVLVSQEVVDRATSAQAAFAEIGPVELKGVGEPIVLHAARRATA
jgi:adenylate cyclase